MPIQNKSRQQLKPKRFNLLRHLIPLIISCGLLYWILRNYEFSGVINAVRNSDSIFLIPVFVTFGTNLFFRALRWRTLFDDSNYIKWKHLFKAQMIGYLANNILPARAGELIRAYNLGKHQGIAVSKVLATIVVERLADLLLALMLLAIMLLIYPLPVWFKRGGMVIGIFAFTGCVILILLYSYGETLIDRCRHLLRFIPKNIFEKLERIGMSFIAGITGLSKNWQALRFIAYTIIIWITEVFIVYLVSSSFDLSLKIIEALFVFLVIGICSIIPSMPGQIGTYEFCGISALEIVNVTGSYATGFVLILHAIVLLGTSSLGLLCLIIQRHNSEDPIKFSFRREKKVDDNKKS